MKKKHSLEPRQRNILILIGVLLLVFFVYNLTNNTNLQTNARFSDFLSLLKNGQIEEVVITGENLSFQDKYGKKGVTVIPPGYDTALYEKLYRNNARFRVENTESDNILLAIFTSWFPILLIIGFWFFISRQLNGSGKIMQFGNTQVKKKTEETKKVTLQDVAGVEEAKEEVREIIEFLKNPQKFQEVGATIPRGILLYGPPGTGKTLLARAIAGEANASFFNISGSHFVEMFVGIGSSRVRDLFARARAQQPAIIFIDEIDAVGRHRGSGLGGGNDEREQTLNQLLVEIDGFNTPDNIIVIAATNRPDILDPALTRPGRFDRQVQVSLPHLEGRKAIVEIYLKKIKKADDISVERIAQSTTGFSGAELENLVNEAALIAGKNKKDVVTMENFYKAKDKIVMGLERKTLTIDKKEKKTTAYHEAGHALVAALNKETDTLDRVTIIPHGQALGVTSFMPKEEYEYTKEKLTQTLYMMMGGRAAEEVILKQFTTGASNDLERASQIAYQMVCNWGMSSKIGPIYLANENQDIFLGRDLMKQNNISQHLAKQIDEEVTQIVNTAYSNAVLCIKNNLKAMEMIVEELILNETIDGEVVHNIIKKTQT